jgi:ribosomal protein S26
MNNQKLQGIRSSKEKKLLPKDRAINITKFRDDLDVDVIRKIKIMISILNALVGKINNMHK